MEWIFRLRNSHHHRCFCPILVVPTLAILLLSKSRPVPSHTIGSHLALPESKALASSGTSGLQGGFPVRRPNSFGSGSCLSTSGSHSSSSSGRGSLSSPTGVYLCGPKLRGVARGQGRYSEHPGVLDEDDMDQESGSQNLLSEWL